MTNDPVKVKLAILDLLARAERSNQSKWRFQDWCLRKYSIRGRSQSSPDQLRSNRQRSTNQQDLRQWRVK